MILITIFLILFIVIYAFKIEPYLIKVKKYNINKKTENKIKIVQISDIHIKNNFTPNHLNKIIKKINEQNPDIVVFTGDLYDNYNEYNDDENLIKSLSSIKSKYKFAVLGNHDYVDSGNKYKEIMKKANFTILDNSTEKLLFHSKTIYVSGISDLICSKPNFDLKSNKPYNILLTHQPEAATKMKNKFDLILSGHTHGGQFIIPYIAIISSKFLKGSHHSLKYTKGFYNKENQKLYVNSGLGTTRISARLGSIPEITLFNLYL